MKFNKYFQSMFNKIIVCWPRPFVICLLAHKCQAKYKCKLRHFQLSVVSSPGAANPGKVPLIPQRDKREGVSISTATERGVSRSGTQEIILRAVFNGIQKTQDLIT